MSYTEADGKHGRMLLRCLLLILIIAAPAGWIPSEAASQEVRPVEAAECEQDVARVADGSLEFEAGRPDTRAGSVPVIDAIAHALLRCPDAPVAVAGHTDSDGTRDANLDLSLARARTVIEMLVDAGLPEARFTAVGYGESRPLASNASETGKARNRRIEILLRD